MEIDLSLLAFEVLNFGVLVLLFRRFLFRPVRATLEARRREIESLRLETRDREAAADTMRTDYERRLSEFDRDVEARIDRALTEARERASRLIAEGRVQARRIVEEAEAEVDAGRKRALAQLRGEVMALGVDAAERVVRHMGASSVGLAYARRGGHELREVLGDRVPSGPFKLEVGPDLEEAEAEAALREVCPEATFEVETNPDIVAGVRIVALGHEIESSVSASLDAWYAQQVGA